jgi:DEAD/DEAH box helicase domain-containing protein
MEEEKTMDIEKILSKITSSRSYEGQIVHSESIKERQGKYDNVDIKPLLRFALHERGIKRLYSHQTEAIEKIRSGKDIVLATSTASGKSLAYTIPVFEEIMDHPDSTVLYISPLNALANDQYSNFVKLRDILGERIDIGRFVGSSSKEERWQAKADANIIFTNPEMLHMSVLGWKQQWYRVLSNLKYIILDESHYYTGVTGSNMANLLRRLQRICDHYGSNPQYICCSATIGNPGKHACNLTGKNMEVIDRDGSGRGAQKFVFWNPPAYYNKKGYFLRKSSFADSNRLFTTLIQEGLQTILFTRSRQKMERMYLQSKKELQNRGLKERIAPYRGGYSPEDRILIEKQLQNGTLKGVLSTNALELGIDIGGLDGCILDEFPGTIMSTRQQAGRAGRGENESMVVLVAGQNALDQYYMRNPEKFFAKSCEEAVINPENTYIQTGHILCAAKELPLQQEDEKYFGSGIRDVIGVLKEEKLLAENEKGTICLDNHPHGQVNIRGAGRNGYCLIDTTGGKRKIIEKDLERSMAFREAFEGAIYIHMGNPYVVQKMNHSKKEILVEKGKADYYTKPMVASEIFLREKYEEKKPGKLDDITVGLGRVEVVEQVTGFRRIRHGSDEEMGRKEIEMPPSSLETESLWIDLPAGYEEMVSKQKRDFAGGLHAIEHAMIAMYPVHLLADRNDVAGVSTPSHGDLEGRSGIFIYDGHEGGVGFAENGFDKIEEMLDVTLKAIKGCPCEEGCPSCIQSPKCGNNNEPLDKHAAIMIMHEILGLEKYIPPAKKERKTVSKSQGKLSTNNTSNTDALNRARSKLRNKKKASVEELIIQGQECRTDHKKAYELFSKALEMEPSNKNALFNKGVACIQLGKYSQANRCFDTLVQQGMNKPVIWEMKGRAFHGMCNYGMAIQMYKQALGLHPKDKDDIKRIQELLGKARKSVNG